MAAVCQEGGTTVQSCGMNLKVASGHIPKTIPFAFSADEGADVGLDGEIVVSEDYQQGNNRFTGAISKVTIDVFPTGLSPADQKAVDIYGGAAATAED